MNKRYKTENTADPTIVVSTFEGKTNGGYVSADMVCPPASIDLQLPHIYFFHPLRLLASA